MPGVKNLDTLLKSMEPVLQPEEYVFCTVPYREANGLDLECVCRFREAEGLTLIVSRAEAEKRKLAFIYSCRMITLNIHSSLEAVGFLAAVTAKLAASGI